MLMPVTHTQPAGLYRALLSVGADLNLTHPAD